MVERVMVDNVHPQIASHTLESGQALCVHQDGACDLAPAEVVGLDEGEFSAVQRQEGLPIPVDTTG